MDKKLKTKWVKALRSGKFQQARQKLRTSPTRMCCLGVLRYLADPADKRSNGNGMLSDEQLTAFGLKQEQQGLLAQMNDGEEDFSGKPCDFKQIATYIQKHL